jgi:hypothetical protein
MTSDEDHFKQIASAFLARRERAELFHDQGGTSETVPLDWALQLDDDTTKLQAVLYAIYRKSGTEAIWFRGNVFLLKLSDDRNGTAGLTVVPDAKIKRIEG